MTSPKTILPVVVSVALLVVAAVLVFLWRGDRSSTANTPNTVSPAAPRGTSARSLEEQQNAMLQNELQSRNPLPATDDAGRKSPESTATFIAGSVTEAKTGGPVCTFGIELYRAALNPGDAIKRFYREFCNEEGCFLYPLETGGVYWMNVYSAADQTAECLEVLVPGSGGLSDFRVELDPGKILSGSVVDAVSGGAVAGAVVFNYGNADLSDILTGSPSLARHTTTDEQGKFALGGLDDWIAVIVAVHPEYSAALRLATPGEAGIVIALGRGHSAFGHVFDDSGRRCPGVMVSAEEAFPYEAGERFVRRPVLSDAKGVYRTPPLNQGAIRLVASLPGDEDQGPVAFTREERSVELADCDVQVDFGPMRLYTTWRGVVNDRTGMPPEPALLILTPFERFGEELSNGNPCSRKRYFATGWDGRFELRKLLPGRYQLEIAFGPQFNHHLRYEDAFLKTTGVVDRDIVIEGGSIRGRVIDEVTGARPSSPFCVQAKSAEMSHSGCHTVADKKGVFVFRGLDPGTYSLTADLSRDNRRGIVENVVVESGCLVDEIRLLIPTAAARRGFARVRFNGFEDLLDTVVYLHFDSTKPVQGYGDSIRIQYNDGDCSYQIDHLFEAGPWTVEARIPQLGSIEKSFEVFGSQTATIWFSQSDFAFARKDE